MLEIKITTTGKYTGIPSESWYDNCNHREKQQHTVEYRLARYIAILFILGVAGCSSNRSSESSSTYCSDPAPLHGQSDPDNSSYIVGFNENVDVDAEVNFLTDNYELQISRVFKESLKGFAGEMSIDTREQLRCYQGISSIEHNQLSSPTN